MTLGGGLAAGRYWRTVRYLRLSQVVSRASFVAERRLVRARPGVLVRRYERQLEEVRAEVRDAPAVWRWPPAPLDPAARASRTRAEEVLAGRWTFLNETRSLGYPVDWSAPGASRLWRFHLHYFEYAVDLAVSARRQEPGALDRLRELVDSWIARHPVGEDGDAWHPFVASSRLMAWIVARDLLIHAGVSPPKARRKPAERIKALSELPAYLRRAVLRARQGVTSSFPRPVHSRLGDTEWEVTNRYAQRPLLTAERSSASAQRASQMPHGREDARAEQASGSAWTESRESHDTLAEAHEAQAFDRRWRDSLLVHGLFVEAHLERDVGGNHLLKNAVALLLAGCAFEGGVASRWAERAAAVLEREIERQVLPDGGHYERSPMYHALVLSDLLAALFAAGVRQMPVAVPLAAAVRRMQPFAASFLHPDGEIPLFNDAVLDEAPPPLALVGPSTDRDRWLFSDTGYARLRVATSQTDGVLLFDCGAPGPDDLPAHVHADALALEVSVGLRRVLVDGGVVTYEAGPARQYYRGTRAHNTVEVAGRDQSEVWGGFRVGARARVRLDGASEDQTDGTRVVTASHDGYRRLGVRRHERAVVAVPGSGWRVLDTLYGQGTRPVASRLRLHPDLVWQADEGRYWAATQSGERLLEVRPIGPLPAVVETGWYADRFNREQRVEVLTLRGAAWLPLVFGYWLLLPGGGPRLS